MEGQSPEPTSIETHSPTPVFCSPQPTKISLTRNESEFLTIPRFFIHSIVHFPSYKRFAPWIVSVVTVYGTQRAPQAEKFSKEKNKIDGRRPKHFWMDVRIKRIDIENKANGSFSRKWLISYSCSGATEFRRRKKLFEKIRVDCDRMRKSGELNWKKLTLFYFFHSGCQKLSTWIPTLTPLSRHLSFHSRDVGR